MTESKVYPVADFKPLCTLIPSKRILGRASIRIEEDCKIVGSYGVHAIEKGMIVDGATVPWYLRPAFPAIAKYLGATTIHDKWCAYANERKSYNVRELADNGFYDDLILCGTNKTRAKLMSFAVKKYGLMLKAKGELK